MNFTVGAAFLTVLFTILFMAFMILGSQSVGARGENLRLYKKCLVENKTLTYEAATELCSQRVK
jgi:hypothetical protein